MNNLKIQKHQQVDIFALVNNAAKCISPVWPLETFIACNPLQGFEHLPFEEALLEGKRLFGSAHAIPKLELVNRELIKWCGVFLDMGQGSIEAPNRHEGFYAAFLSLSIYDHSLHLGSKSVKDWLAKLPVQAEETILICLDKLGVSDEHYESFLKESFAYLPGWAGYIKWRSVWKNPSSEIDTCPVTLVEFMAVRLAITVALWPQACLEKKKSQQDRLFIDKMVAKIKKSEQIYQDKLIQQLMPQIKHI